MKPITIGFLATAAFLLCGEARAQALLSAAELEKLMVGNTVRFHHLVSGWRAMSYFDADGTVLVGDEHIVLGGSWRILADGTHCVALGLREICAAVRSNADGTHSPVANGKPVMTWLAVTKKMRLAGCFRRV